jgi:hypothetical protein
MGLDTAVWMQYVHEMDWGSDSEAAFEYVTTQIIELSNSCLAGLKEQRITKVSHVGKKLIREAGVSKVILRLIGVTIKRTVVSTDLNRSRRLRERSSLLSTIG